MKGKRLFLTFLIVLILSVLFISCDKKSSTVDKTNQIDVATQKILDNDKFLKSEEGQDFQINAWKFAKAFLDGDLEYIKSNLITPKDYDEIYSYQNKFSNLEYMLFRFNNFDNKTKIAQGDYILLFNQNIYDGNIYLEFTMKLDNGKWKIIDYVVEK